MERWKSRGGKSQRREEKREDKRRERVRRKKMQVREKVAKSRFTVFFQWFVAPEGQKVGSLKRRVRSHLARWDMPKMHAVVARSTFHTFRSQNVQSTPGSKHFWKLRRRKSALRCGAKHMWKSKCTNTSKHTMCGPLLEVEMLKKCMPLWREVHFQVKMYKAPHVRSTLEVEMSKKCAPLWREAHIEVKM